MASVFIPSQQRTIDNPTEISEFLKPFGIWFEQWQVAGRLQPTATDQDILTEYAPEIEQIKKKGGFVTADVINVHADTPNLDTMLQKFNKEHTHSEDEVRFTVSGKGIFHLDPEGGPVFGVTVESGDMINVPCGMKHWFNIVTTNIFDVFDSLRIPPDGLHTMSNMAYTVNSPRCVLVAVSCLSPNGSNR